MKRPIVIIFLVSIFICLLLILQITLSNEIAVIGANLESMQNETEILKDQNLVIQQQVLQASSLTVISQKAYRLGYVPDKAPVYLNAPLPLALNQ